jgi:hypothetical protein
MPGRKHVYRSLSLLPVHAGPFLRVARDTLGIREVSTCALNKHFGV